MRENDCENGAQCKGAPRGMRRARLKPDYMDRPRPGTKRKYVTFLSDDHIVYSCRPIFSEALGTDRPQTKKNTLAKRKEGELDYMIVVEGFLGCVAPVFCLADSEGECTWQGAPGCMQPPYNRFLPLQQFLSSSSFFFSFFFLVWRGSFRISICHLFYCWTAATLWAAT